MALSVGHELSRGTTTKLHSRVIIMVISHGRSIHRHMACTQSQHTVHAAEKRCFWWSIVTICIIIMIMTGIVILVDWVQSLAKPGTTDAYLVETLPVGLVRIRTRGCLGVYWHTFTTKKTTKRSYARDFDLPPVPGIRNTWEELTALVNSTSSLLEITAMWVLASLRVGQYVYIRLHSQWL